MYSYNQNLEFLGILLPGLSVLTLIFSILWFNNKF